MAIAIIGGSGTGALINGDEPQVVVTPYGEALVTPSHWGGREILFLARHGVGHAVPPHRINYRANIWALQALGARDVVALSAVGSLNTRMAPGDFVLLGQFLDWTHGRPSTFFDGDDGRVVHVDMTEPYCPRLTGYLTHAGMFLDDHLHVGGVYACTEGPRFETPAEIKALRILGADLVGMTNVPEVALAREAGLCYTAVAMVSNWAAGIGPTPLSQQEVLDIITLRMNDLQTLLSHFLTRADTGRCSCASLGAAHALPSGPLFSSHKD